MKHKYTKLKHKMERTEDTTAIIQQKN